MLFFACCALLVGRFLAYTRCCPRHSPFRSSAFFTIHLPTLPIPPVSSAPTYLPQTHMKRNSGRTKGGCRRCVCARHPARRAVTVPSVCLLHPILTLPQHLPLYTLHIYPHTHLLLPPTTYHPHTCLLPTSFFSFSCLVIHTSLCQFYPTPTTHSSVLVCPCGWWLGGWLWFAFTPNALTVAFSQHCAFAHVPVCLNSSFAFCICLLLGCLPHTHLLPLHALPFFTHTPIPATSSSYLCTPKHLTTFPTRQDFSFSFCCWLSSGWGWTGGLVVWCVPFA